MNYSKKNKKMSEIVNGKPQNEATEKELRTRSTFGLNYNFYQTMRFGEYTPHFVMEGVNNDRLPLHSGHTIKSYTMGAPLMSDIKINKDYFFVPMQAILPNNWEKWYENPVIGQDVPNDCGPSVEKFWDKVGTLFNNSWTYLRGYPQTSGATYVTFVDYIFKFLVFFERFYSDGNLMSNLGIHGGQFFGTSIDDEKGSYDDWMNLMIDTIFTGEVKGFKFQYGSNTSLYYEVKLSSTSTLADRIVELRDYLEMLRDDFSWTIVQLDLVSGSQMNDVETALNQFYSENTGVANTVSGVHCDLRRMWAYQIVCYHYYTNDKVDYIYSAELFRQYINQLVTNNAFSGQSNKAVFSVNGLEYQYDALSAKYFDIVISNFTTSGIFGYASSGTIRPQNLTEAYAYMRALLGFNNSLRYKDYFTGGRTRPLAVGDTTIDQFTPVVSGFVGAIDITRNIQKQRFLNAINRIPHQIEDYLETLFGKRPAPDYHNPFFLAQTRDDVFGQESEYTGNVSDAEQNNVTSTLRGQANRYAFEFTPDRDCVVIGITSFDLPRAYSRTIERQALHLTRFDGFNPYMQFVGDQQIYRAELSPYSVDMNPFAYTLRHMEYKQRFDQVAGGFKRYLPGWAFIAEDNTRPYLSNIDPVFIRSHNTELDKYFLRLNGYSLGSYFHFIVKNTNTMEASRPMAYAPSIL